MSASGAGEWAVDETCLVVGVDGSPGSRTALEYAMAEAARRGAQLRAVAAVMRPEFWATSYGLSVPALPGDIVGDVRKEMQQFVDEVVAADPDRSGVVPLGVEARAGRAGEVLVDAAEGAELLVVGHRGRGAVATAMLGSVGLHCLLHAGCPVTVVPPPATAGGGTGVVVGVDGSPAARAALEFALVEAARRDAPLRVVSAVALPEFWASYYGELVPPPPEEIVGKAREEALRLVDDVVAAGGAAARGLPIDVDVRPGRPGEVLVDAAAGAALLVVGHRGRGSVSSVLLGSVGLECVLHASCPVTVVRPAPEVRS